MLIIASFIGGSLKGKSRKHVSYIENVYLIRTENFISKYIIISYLIRSGALLSYKYKSISIFISLLRISLYKKEGKVSKKQN